jgi:RNA polymerase sigma factor (sigma-70 family)
MDDQLLLAGLMSRDESAVRKLMTTFQPKVVNTVLNLVHNREDAEEITQDVFIEVINSAARFRLQSSVSTWIYRISVNKSLDFLRMKKRKKRFAFFTSLVSETNELIHELPDFVHPGVIMERKEEARYFYRALGQLGGKQKAAIVLSQMEGLSCREISEIMKISESSVESLLVRAKRNLRTILENYFQTKRRNN